MDTFNFPYHKTSVEYPESGFRLNLGNSYTYNAGPSAPDQRIFRLYFETMIYKEAKITSQASAPTGALGDIWIDTDDGNKFYRFNGSSWALSTNKARVNIHINPELNAGALEDFYLNNKLYKKFTYPHPIYGSLEVRFNKPLVLPKGVHGGNGTLEAFELEFIEVP